MSMYYEHDMNLSEIAAVLKVTESRVSCQLHSQIARCASSCAVVTGLRTAGAPRMAWPLPRRCWPGPAPGRCSSSGRSAPAWLALGAAVALGAGLATQGATRWRAGLIFAGFPLSWLATGFSTALPPGAWLVPLAGLALVYRCAAGRMPLFLTPRGSRCLAARLLPPEACVLDAGCGLGDALVEARPQYRRRSSPASSGARCWPSRRACAAPRARRCRAR